MITKKRFLLYKVEGDGPTIEEILEQERQEKMKENPEEVISLGKWGEKAKQMMQEYNNTLYSTLKKQQKLVDYLTNINKQCEEQFISMMKEMQPKAIGDFMTDWQNKVAVANQIEEVLLYEIIEPQAMAQVDYNE